MEINTQKMEALLHLQEQQAQLLRKQPNAGSGFEELLVQQIGLDRGMSGVNPMLGMDALYPPLGVQGDENTVAADADTAVLLEAFDQASGTLDMWDKYKNTLATSSTDTALRDAWAMLQGIDRQVSQMRGNPLRGTNAELDSLLNELEIMATTEKFKFNRGDYIS